MIWTLSTISSRTYLQLSPTYLDSYKFTCADIPYIQCRKNEREAVTTLAGSMHAVSHRRTSKSHSQVAKVCEILKDPVRHGAHREPPHVPMTNGAGGKGQQVSLHAWSTTRPQPHNLDVTRGDSWRQNPKVLMANEKADGKMFLITESGHNVIAVYSGRATPDVNNRFHTFLLPPPDCHPRTHLECK